MDSDDDFESFSGPSNPSPQRPHRRLKRLKRAIDSPNISPIIHTSISNLDPILKESLLDYEESNAPITLPTLDIGSDEDCDQNLLVEKAQPAKRELEFNEEISEVTVDFKMENLEKKRTNVVDLDQGHDEDMEKKKNKKKRMDSEKLKMPVANKRKEEKERKLLRQQLHAETQRVLRETRDVGFRPAPVVHKPISSVLEKIRQKKLQVLKRTITINNTSDEPGALRDWDDSVEDVEAQQSSKTVDNEEVAKDLDMEGNQGVSPMGISRETTTHSSHEEAPVQKELHVEPSPTPAFRVPVDDTQDLFDDSQENSSKDELLGDKDSPLEEPFAPSLLAMKLKFDSALPDDSSSDGEDNEKENVRPYLHEDYDDCTSPKGDPVKAFIDEEAEEEDSDNDIKCLRDDDEDEDMDAEELNDIIATDYEERHTDKERRDELHRKWLEQQDAAGTDNLLQRFNYNSKSRETTLVDEEHTDNEDEEEFSNEVQDAVPRDNGRMNLKRAKQMIAQMFIDKDDVFLSDEEEEKGKMLEKQRLLRSEERAKLMSPAEDENSREVFGLIKKVNIVPEHKRKPKQASILDFKIGERSDSSLKSPFIGRVHLPSSKGQQSSVMRSFVFGRDDSNSRSSILTAEDSSDTVSEDIKSSRTTTAKFTSSQVRPSQSSSSFAGGKAAETTLLDILLKKSSTPSSVKSTGISMSGLSGSVLEAFKIPRRPVRAEGRGL